MVGVTECHLVAARYLINARSSGSGSLRSCALQCLGRQIDQQMHEWTESTALTPRTRGFLRLDNKIIQVIYSHPMTELHLELPSSRSSDQAHTRRSVRNQSILIHMWPTEAFVSIHDGPLRFASSRRPLLHISSRHPPHHSVASTYRSLRMSVEFAVLYQIYLTILQIKSCEPTESPSLTTRPSTLPE